MRIKVQQYEFIPSNLVVFFALVFFCLFVVMGNWQLNRANLKRDIQQRYLQQLEKPFQYIVLEHEADDSLKYRKISVKGQYLNDKILLVDNKLNQGQPGYHVVMPFMINGGQKVVLVNRGWVAADYDRTQLPQIRQPKTAGLVQGIITIPSTEGYRMGEVQLTSNWPQRIPYVDMANIRQGLDFEILPYVIWLSPEVDDYYVRDWKPVWSPPEKSEAYALQWFSFAFIVLILFVGLNTKKIKSGDTNE
jgi:surfeit locus 1 family protein